MKKAIWALVDMRRSAAIVCAASRGEVEGRMEEADGSESEKKERKERGKMRHGNWNR